jgi:hypothetical protein
MTHWTLFGARERNAAIEAIEKAPDLYRVELREPKRSDEQNKRLWAMISEIMRQKPGWFGPNLDADDIKQVFLASLFKELRMARNADGDGYVPLVRRSSRLSWREFGELLTLIEAWGARHGVVFHEPEEKAA